jgi:hypothetical protein
MRDTGRSLYQEEKSRRQNAFARAAHSLVGARISVALVGVRDANCELYFSEGDSAARSADAALAEHEYSQLHEQMVAYAARMSAGDRALLATVQATNSGAAPTGGNADTQLLEREI